MFDTKTDLLKRKVSKIKQRSITNFKISHTFQCRSDSFFNEKLCNCVADQDTTTQVTKSTLQVYSVQQSKIQEPFKLSKPKFHFTVEKIKTKSLLMKIWFKNSPSMQNQQQKSKLLVIISKTHFNNPKKWP